jgi:hypothetical protein
MAKAAKYINTNHAMAWQAQRQGATMNIPTNFVRQQFLRK